MAREFRQEDREAASDQERNRGLRAQAKAEAERKAKKAKQPPREAPVDGLPDYGVWRRSARSAASVRLSETGARIQGGPDHEILSDKTFGNIIKGPVSLTASPTGIRIAGLFVMNPILTGMIPSTIITPVPTLIFSPPLGSLQAFREQVQTLMSFLG